MVILLMALSGCYRPQLPEGHYKLGSPYTINGKRYYPFYDPDYDQTGIASWYGAQFHNKRTANGEIFNKDTISAAHPTLPLPSIVEVTNLENGRRLQVRVNDRGPFIDNRLIDLSEAAAKKLGFHRQGLAKVRVEFLRLAESNGRKPVPQAGLAPDHDHDGKSLARTPSPTRTLVIPSAVVAKESCEPKQELYLQVAAFRDFERARMAERSISHLGNVRTERVETEGQTMTRLHLGPIENASDLVLKQKHLEHLGFTNAFAVEC